MTHVVHLGRSIPATLRTAIETRDQTCVIAGCDVDRHLEIDHNIPYAQGGPNPREPRPPLPPPPRPENPPRPPKTRAAGPTTVARPAEYDTALTRASRAAARARIGPERTVGRRHRSVRVQQRPKAGDPRVVGAEQVDEPADRGVQISRTGVDDGLDVGPVLGAVEEGLEHDQLGRAEDRDVMPAKGTRSTWICGGVVERVRGEEQVDRGVVPEEPHLAVPPDPLDVVGVPRRPRRAAPRTPRRPDRARRTRSRRCRGSPAAPRCGRPARARRRMHAGRRRRRARLRATTTIARHQRWPSAQAAGRRAARAAGGAAGARPGRGPARAGGRRLPDRVPTAARRRRTSASAPAARTMRRKRADGRIRLPCS